MRASYNYVRVQEGLVVMLPTWLLCVELAVQIAVAWFAWRSLRDQKHLTRWGKGFYLFLGVFCLASTIGRLWWNLQGLPTPFWMGEYLVTAVLVMIAAVFAVAISA